jgi:hypothetical protein
MKDIGHLPDDPTALAVLAETLAAGTRAETGCTDVQASDILVMIAQSAAAVLAASLRALQAVKPAPNSAERALAATYERYADELAAIEAARSAEPWR